jgi:hypothetical protein
MRGTSILISTPKGFNCWVQSQQGGRIRAELNASGAQQRRSILNGETSWRLLLTRRSGENGKAPGDLPEDQVLGSAEPEPTAEPQRQFFEHAGSIFSVVVSPAASTIAVNASRQFKALPPIGPDAE